MHEWTTANLITVNPIKSSVMIIPPKQRQVLSNFNIHINSSKISVHESAKYLGIHLDCHLNFRQLINFLESEIARSVGILTKIKHVLPEKTLDQFILCAGKFSFVTRFDCLGWDI